MLICSHCSGEIRHLQPARSEQPPNPGDWYLCPECLGWSIFANADELRKPDRDELVDILRDPQSKIILDNVISK